MRKANILSIFILALTVVSIGCGGSGTSGSGSTLGAAPSGDSTGGPTPLPTPTNSAPVANAGLDKTAPRGTAVYLEGTASSDPDGDLLSFQWSILTLPTGSTATLAKANQPSPYFTPDQEGNYVIQLIVVDAKGLASSPDTVTVSTINSAPIADAGPDQIVTSLGTAITLGGESWDPDGDSISYSWAMTSKPAGSMAILSDPASPNPTFVADVYGDYMIELVVTDSWASSPSDSVKVSFGNLRPVADGGNSFAMPRGSVVNLDGSASYDPNGDPITYQWSFVSKPTGSTAELMASTAVNPSFISDMAGTYVLNLVVSDGVEQSDPGSATVAIFSTLNAPIQDLLDALQALNNLPSNAFKSRNMKRELANKINTVIVNIDGGNSQLALSELETDILKKMDGCAKNGSPEHNDWITNCGAQGEVYSHISSAIAAIKTM